ncbi:MAG: DUF427 domain-containing protein [Acidobacteriota bacterium]|nr:MAG: DUF427 domain-containing protein [Acidobacteriota bacterium]
MPKAILNGTVIAESDATEVVEGNRYFPPDSVRKEFLTPSETESVCPWKGTAKYYTVSADGRESVDAAWYYPAAKEAAKRIEGYVAFWRDVEVVE